jgi:nitrate/nitrite transporter NarK
MIPAIFNALIPVAAKSHVSLIIIIRLIIGGFHGVVYSSLFSMYSKWFPKKEITLAITGTTFGGTFGAVLVSPVTGYLCRSSFLDGWPSAFYVTSVIHIIWFALWWRFVHSSPAEDPRISDKELNYISKNIFASNTRARNKISVPWKAIITSKVVWASALTKVLGGFGYFLLCVKMPKYLDSIFGMEIYTNGWLNAYMYLVMCVSLMIGGPLSTYIKYKGWISSLTIIRKLFQAFCNLIYILLKI